MPPLILPVWEFIPRSPSPSSPIPDMPGAPRRMEGPHVLTSTMHTSTSPGCSTRGHNTAKESTTLLWHCQRQGTQLGQVFCCLWKFSAHAGSSSPPNPAVFSFHISCFPFFGAFESSVRPCSLPHNRKVVVGTSSPSGTRSAPTSQGHWHHPCPCRPHSPLSPCSAHTLKLSCALVKLPLLQIPAQELPPHLPTAGQQHLPGFSCVPLTPWASMVISPRGSHTTLPPDPAHPHGIPSTNEVTFSY